ncbi:MAG TPA: universal stress protein, partial [Planctomycetota bacterium]|nr:universal stress protein [Planctomycetota bacterium]
MIRRILIPLDGSPTSEVILPAAIRLAHRGGADVCLVQAEHPLVTEHYAAIAQISLSGAQEYLLGVGRRFEDEGIATRVFTPLGSPQEAILRIATQEEVSLIAMATHGRTGFSRLIRGSVAEQVLRSSRVPVYVVRPPGPGE